MELGLQMERELSPARYLRRHLKELPACGDHRAVSAAIEAAVALEDCDPGRARRSWRTVVRAARAAGLAARRAGTTPRRLSVEVDRLREAMETVLFDGRLPADLAAWASRWTAKMCTRAVEHALCAYWRGEAEANPGGRPPPRLRPPFCGYKPEPRILSFRTDRCSSASHDRGEA